jgi:hypothetical protein
MTADMLDSIIDATPVVEQDPVLDDLHLARFTDDIARKIHPYEVVAARYGLSVSQMVRLIRIPAVAKIIKAKRAVYESDNAAQERLRAAWGEGLVQAAPSQIAMMMDERTPHGVRVELFKVGARITGADGGGRGDGMSGAAPGTKFSVSFNFTGLGRKEAFAAETVTIEGQAGG